MNGPEVGIELDDQIRFWYNEEALGVPETS